jgi:hypothetical protein
MGGLWRPVGNSTQEADEFLGASADEVDNLELVSAMDGGCGPGCARDDFAVVLDGNAVCLEFERGNELVKRARRRCLRKDSLAAIELDGEGFHCLSVAGTI